MELRQLATFREVASALSFTRAAEALDYAQSSVSSQIQELELELGIPLFERLGKRILLSDAGRRLQPYAERLLQLADEALYRAKLKGRNRSEGAIPLEPVLGQQTAIPTKSEVRHL